MPSSAAALIEGAIFELDDFEPDGGDADFSLDDIQVAPRIHIKSKPRTQRNKAKTSSKSKPVCTRPLIFPHEILEFVCEHLSQATLRFCASLVSKQWQVVCNRFIRRVGVWKPLANDYQDALLAKLSSLNALECWAVYDPDVAVEDNNILLSQHRNAWEYFFSRALQPFEHADLPPAPQCLLHHIRDFSVRFRHSALDTHAAMLSILPGLRLLHTLNIHFESYGTVSLFTILESCPFLINLKVRAVTYNALYAIHGDAADDIPLLPPTPPTPANGTVPVEPPKAQSKPVYLQRYRLINLVLRGLVIKQSVLERVPTTCPDLRVFRVHEASKSVWKSGGYVTEPLDRPKIMDLILAQCRKIEWIHLALYNTSDQQSMDLMADHCPTHKSLALQSSEHFWELSPVSSRAILHDIIVLEVPRYEGSTFSQQALNSILRRTPNLQHLDAHGVHMDASSLIWGPVPYFPKPKSKREAKRFAAQDKRKQRESRQVAARQAAKAAAAEVAICPFSERTIPAYWNFRGLKSLKIRTFHHMAVKDDNFFKYLIQFCPQLEELHLWMKYFRIGQIVKFPDGKTTRSSSGAAKGKEKIKDTEPERLENSIVLLTGLVRMKYLTLEISNELKGILQPSDFEFMRKNPARALDADSTWPDLESFHIRCSRIEVHQSMRAITAAVHDIRPAVEFRIKKDPSLHLDIWQ
ncbi:hypothetical protein BGZ82_002716 [Podila clonocystis]|nr:hypothetical protein BGZ82_002716 [Podila clonocystis]